MSKTYVTKQDDMWDAIAYAQLGDTSYMDQLIALNREYREYYVFPAGITLVLPEATPDAPAIAPPWRKGGTV